MSQPIQINSGTVPARNLAATIILAGLIAGTADALSATINFLLSGGSHPERIWKYVASGAFGPSALRGGTPMILAGLLFHYFIAFTFTVLFFLIYPRMSVMRKNKWVTAIAYGLFAWCVMNLLVVPLSRIPAHPLRPSRALIEAGILIIAIGLPLSLIAHARYRQRTAWRSGTA